MRSGILAKVKRIVIKIGSGVLTCGDNGLNKPLMGSIAAQVAELRASGRQVIIVSSGAVAAGRKELGIDGRPRSIPQKQAAAAIGQSRLMHAYEEAFDPFGHKVAQSS